MHRSSHSRHEGADHSLNIELSQVRVLLADADEDDGLARGVHHVEGRANLLVDGVELGHDDAIDNSWILVLNGEVDKRLVELGQLVNRIIANQCLTDEQDRVRLVDVDELRERSHQGLVALHSASGVDENDVVLLALGFLQGFFGDDGRVILVALLVEWKIKAGCVSLQLLDGSRPEVVAARHHDSQVALRLQVVRGLRERGRLADSVDSDERDRVDVAFLLGGERLLKNVDVLLRRQEPLDGLDQRSLNRGSDGREARSLGVDE